MTTKTPTNPGAAIDYATASDTSLKRLAKYGNTAQICSDAKAEIDRRKAGKATEALLLDIARRHLIGIETFESRGVGSLDFHEVSVWSLRDALLAAYEAGKASR